MGRKKSVYGDSLTKEYEDRLNKEKREERGIYYTPSSLVSYMVKRAKEFSKKSVESSFKILDPSCGVGEFLKKIEEEFENVEIHGVDIDGEAIEIAKKRIENTEYSNVKFFNNDFLIDFEEDGYDFILGNPPYLGEKNHKEMFDILKEHELGKLYYEKGMDYFYFFIEKSLDILKPGGILGFVTSSYWPRADFANKLRERIKREGYFLEVLDFCEYRVFDTAKGHHSMVFFLKKSEEVESFRYKKLRKTKTSLDEILNNINDKDIWEIKECKNINTINKFTHFYFGTEEELKIIEKIKLNSKYTLDEICEINQGIVSGADRSKDSEKGIFVLSKEELKEKGIYNGEYLKPFFKSKDISRYKTKEECDWNILYLNKKFEIEKYLEVENHMKSYQILLQERRECKKGVIPWYSLQWPRKQKIFESAKIVVPQRSRENIFGFNEIPWYASADVYFLTEFQISYKVLLGILNSSLIYFWLYNMGKKKGEYLELYQKPLGEIPIAKCNFDFEEKMNNMIALVFESGSESLQKDIDNLVYEMYGLEMDEIKKIEDFLLIKRKNLLFPG